MLTSFHIFFYFCPLLTVLEKVETPFKMHHFEVNVKTIRALTLSTPDGHPTTSLYPDQGKHCSVLRAWSQCTSNLVATYISHGCNVPLAWSQCTSCLAAVYLSLVRSVPLACLQCTSHLVAMYLSNYFSVGHNVALAWSECTACLVTVYLSLVSMYLSLVAT